MTSQNEEWYKAQEEMRNKLEDEWAVGQSNPRDFIEDMKNGVALSEIVRKHPVKARKCMFRIDKTRKRLQQEDMRIKLGERRSNQEIIMEGLRAGKPLKEIARGYPVGFIRYGSGYKWLEDALLKANPDKPYVIWHYGVPGAGKTRTVRALAPNAAEIVSRNKKFVDGYYGEEEVAWHDFDGSQIQYRKLVHLFDYGKQFIRVRGGHIKWRAKKVWFTSTLSPENQYPESEHLLETIDEIYYWKSKDEWIKIK